MRGYHAGELAVQRRAGAGDVPARLERGIRAELPEPARAFLEGVRMVFAGAVDADGRVWCSILAGAPGFVSTPDERTVMVAARPPGGDPLTAALAGGPAPVGLLALEPQTRRRMRANGTGELGPDGLRVRTEQVYSNCPKYIARRDVEAADAPAAAPAAVARARLTAEDRRLIAAADTFFIATAAPDGGADASHRGGSPGFVVVHDDRRLSFPDYTGNTMYMTLGNITANPRAGLLFVDWGTGATLQLSGRAAIDWAPERAAAFPGAERVVDVTVERVVFTGGAVPQRWALAERSRFNPPAPG